MRTVRNLAWFCVGLFIAFVWLVPQAHAQSVNWTSSVAEGSQLIDKVRTTSAQSYGVLDRISAGVDVKGNRIPVSIAAKVDKFAIAKAYGRVAAKAVPGVGTAIAIAELCGLLCPGNDYRVAPDGSSMQQMEKPGIAGDPPGTGYRYVGYGNPAQKTPQAACQWVADQWIATNTYLTLQPVSISASGGCTVTALTQTVPPALTTRYNNIEVIKTGNFYVPDYTLATEVQTEADVLARAEQQAKFKPLYDALMAQQAANPTAWPEVYNPVKTTTPVDVIASPVSSPERVVSTTTKTMPDGSTDTTTTKEKTVVSPTTTGTTVGDSKTTFPNQTVTTSTTINNVTNNTTTVTNTVEHPADEKPATEDVDPCIGNPNRAGCAVLGDPPETPEIPKLDIPVTFTPVVFASSAGCPAPIRYELYGARSLSYEPLCDVAGYIRAVFLACGAFVCAFIFMDGFKA